MGHLVRIEYYESSLEELAEEGEELIREVEWGNLKFYLDNPPKALAFYSINVMRYQRLFDYLAKGHEFSTKGFGEILKSGEIDTKLDQAILFHEYFKKLSAINKKILESKYVVEPPDNAWKQLAAEFNREIVVKARNAWDNIGEIKPEDKEAITLMKEFNFATAEIGKERYRRYKDLDFDSQKQEWEYSFIRSPL